MGQRRIVNFEWFLVCICMTRHRKLAYTTYSSFCAFYHWIRYIFIATFSVNTKNYLLYHPHKQMFLS
jgi:hypothetical protein